MLFIWRECSKKQHVKTLNQEIMNTKKNRLIIEFMGYEVEDYQHNEFRPIYCRHNSLNTVGEFKNLWNGLDTQIIGRFTEVVSFPFDSDWNYLMAVIKEIGNKTGFTLVMEENTSYWVNNGEYIDDDPEFGGYGNISNILEAVVEFIKWHNQQKS